VLIVVADHNDTIQEMDRNKMITERVKSILYSIKGNTSYHDRTETRQFSHSYPSAGDHETGIQPTNKANVPLAEICTRNGNNA